MDNIPIKNSRRKNYLILSGISQFGTLLVLFTGLFSNEFAITGLLMLNSLFTAMTDVVIDAIMVSQSRLDPKHGSENLQSLSWIMLSLGGIIGCLFAAYITENVDPHYAFFVNSVFGLFVAISAFKIPEHIDKESERETESQGFLTELIQNGKDII